MAITRRGALVAASVGLAMAGAAGAQAVALDQGGQLTDAERQRLEETGPANTKQFIAALRQRFRDGNAGLFRRFIDPRYLKQHGLQDGPFPMRRPITGRIYDNQLTDDPRTAFVVAQTEEAAKECFVFRLTVLEGKVYFVPLSPPDENSKAFSPWILRAKV